MTVLNEFEGVSIQFHHRNLYHLNSYMEVKLVLNALTGVRLIFC